MISCPHDVIGYDHEQGGYTPFHLEDELGPDNCVHGEKGCTSCTRACPRFRHWEPEADEHLFARTRADDEPSGVYQDILLTRASDDHINEVRQDGGLVSAILLWLLAEKYIDGALVSYLDGDAGSWKAKPGVADHTRGGAGIGGESLHLQRQHARHRRGHRPGVVGAGARRDVVSVVGAAGHVAPQGRQGQQADQVQHRAAVLETFDDAIFEELFFTKYGLVKSEIKKMNIKGVFQIWMRDGAYHEIPLKECHAWTREGCNHCPDFAAEHADISTGGIGENANWTLTIVRTDLGREVISRMADAGVIETRPGDDDPGAIALMHKLAEKSRKRWPDAAVDDPKLSASR